MLRPLLALVAVVLLLAGCVQAPDLASPASVKGTVAADWWTNAIPVGDKHDHNDPAQHQNLTTPNFDVVGWDPLVSTGIGATPTGMGCGGAATTKEGKRIAIVQSFDTDVAFMVMDITDAAHPQKLGEYLLPNVHVWDANITADGKHVLVGAYPPALKPGYKPHPGSILPDATDAQSALVQPMWRDACTGATRAQGPEKSLPLGPSIILVGIEDPKNPTFEDLSPQPVIGPHSVTSDIIDGKVWAMSSVTNLVQEVSYYSFYQVVDGPTGGRLDLQTVIETPGHPGPLALNGHTDVRMQKHPLTGKPLAYLANWDGVYIYDMSDPKMPQLLSVWGTDQGSIHDTLPLPYLRDGKHYTIVGQEVGEPVDLPSGWVYILDTTDPAHPKEVSRWTLPVKVKWGGGLMFSPHYVDVQNDTMFVSNYHGGLWAVDITNVSHPEAMGIFVPDKVSPKPDGGKPNGPGIEDVVVNPDGTITIWGNGSGVYMLRFDPTMPATRAPAWQDAHPVK